MENNHPAIIPRELFYRVQEEMTRRASKRKVMQKTGKTELGKYSAKYALSELLVCGECGTPYKRVTWARNGKKRIVWRCISRLEFGTKYCHNSPTLDEEKLHQAIQEAINEFAQAGTEVKEDRLQKYGTDHEISPVHIPHNPKFCAGAYGARMDAWASLLSLGMETSIVNPPWSYTLPALA